MSKRKVNNVFQCRIYDLHDNLVFKEMVSDLETGQKKIISTFEDEHYGATFSHGVVRCLDLGTKNWIVPPGGGITNNHAAFFEPDITPADGWRITVYDMADNAFCTALSENPITEQMYSFFMVNKGAFYCVISARELGAPEDIYTVASVNVNMLFSHHVDSDELPKPYDSLEELLDAFAKPLADDKAENERITRRRKRLEEQ